ncbi:hypothetical protein [Sphingobacterium composti Ten et al. 2007 non Yoo et al. 2007]|uniref:hypothetical protein n=1 Tax=Sphingobacterium composti TaxID=363260 RepID=UPI00135793CB|nr:hypothetical protein [Sphingobacterium composti Ten et al. 2007 non Yoo et al. 2007]
MIISKKIISANLVVILLLGIVNHLSAQIKAEPSKGDTFEYILHEINDFSYYGNDSWPLYDIEVKSYDKRNNTITVIHFNPLVKCKYVETLNLDNIKSVFLYDNALYKVNLDTKKSNRTNMLKITFKSKSNKVDISCEDGTILDNYKDEISIAIYDYDRALKFERAILHMIKLSGNKFNPNLF